MLPKCSRTIAKIFKILNLYPIWDLKSEKHNSNHTVHLMQYRPDYPPDRRELNKAAALVKEGRGETIK